MDRPGFRPPLAIEMELHPSWSRVTGLEPSALMVKTSRTSCQYLCIMALI